MTQIRELLNNINEALPKMREQLEELANTKKDVENLKKSFVGMVEAVSQSNDTVNSLLGAYDGAINQLTGTLRAQQNIETTISNQRQETQEDISKLTDTVNNLVSSFGNIGSVSQDVAQAQLDMKAAVLETTKGVESQVDALKIAMQQAVNTANATDAAGMIAKQREMNKQLETLKKRYENINKVEATVGEGQNTRTRIMTETIKQITESTGDRVLPFFEGLNVYLEKGGTRAEYFAQFLTSNREELKLFGVEVASVRKFMYGFLPPGTFRLVNKFSTALNFVGGTIRSVRADSEEAGNMLTNTLLASTFDTKGFDKLQAKASELKSTIEKLEGSGTVGIGEIEELRIKASDPTSTQEESAQFNEQADFLEETLKNAKEQYAEQKKRLKKLGKSVGAKLLLVSGKISKFSLGVLVKGKTLLSWFNKKTGLNKFADPVLNKLGTVAQWAGGIGQKIGEGVIDIVESLNQFADEMAESDNILKRGLGKFMKFVGFAMKFVFMFTMYLIAFTLIFMFLKKFFDTFGKGIKEGIMDFLPLILQFIGYVWSGFQKIVKGISTIFTGILTADFPMILEGLWEVAKGGLMVLGSFLMISVLGVLSLGWGILKAVGMEILEWGKKALDDFPKNILSAFGDLTSIAIAIAATAALIALLPIQLPLILIAAIGYVVYKAVNTIISAIPGFSSGGVSAGGLAIVGEKGPELVNLSNGSRVHSNNDSRKLLSGGGGTVNNFNITVNARDSSKAEMRRMADEIGRMISSNINRGTSSSTLR